MQGNLTELVHPLRVAYHAGLDARAAGGGQVRAAISLHPNVSCHHTRSRPPLPPFESGPRPRTVTEHGYVETVIPVDPGEAPKLPR